MSKELTDKTHVIVTRRLGNFHITAGQAEHVGKAIEAGMKSILLDGQMIVVNGIEGIVTASQIAELDSIKKGDFKCKYGTWHERGKQCACAEARHLGLL